MHAYTCMHMQCHGRQPLAGRKGVIFLLTGSVVMPRSVSFSALAARDLDAFCAKAGRPAGTALQRAVRRAPLPVHGVRGDLCAAHCP